MIRRWENETGDARVLGVIRIAMGALHLVSLLF